MFLKILTLSFDFAKEQFDTSEFDQFFLEKNILEVKEHFFIKQDRPFLCLLVKYLPQEETAKKIKSGTKQENEVAIDFSTKDMELFNELRKWRAKTCKEEGVPPYIILNNKQLTQIVNLKPVNKANLDSIDGIGKIKIEKYATEILKTVSLFINREGDAGEGNGQEGTRKQ